MSATAEFFVIRPMLMTALQLTCLFLTMVPASIAQTLTTPKLGPASELHSAVSATQVDVIAWMQHTTSEIKKLRQELLDDRTERQESRVGQLERELEQLQRTAKQLEEQDRGYRKELAEIDQQLAASSLPAEERRQLDVVRHDLTSTLSEMLRSDRSAMAQRQAALIERLRQESSRLQILRATTGVSTRDVSSKAEVAR